MVTWRLFDVDQWAISGGGLDLRLMDGGMRKVKAAALPRRLRRERQTIAAMIALYCRDIHGRRGGLCADCQALQDYAGARLDRCRFGQDKPTCVNCPVHCYQPKFREEVRTVMRYAGPRMLWRHPILAVFHLWDGYRQTPLKRVQG